MERSTEGFLKRPPHQNQTLLNSTENGWIDMQPRRASVCFPSEDVYPKKTQSESCVYADFMRRIS